MPRSNGASAGAHAFEEEAADLDQDEDFGDDAEDLTEGLDGAPSQVPRYRRALRSDPLTLPVLVVNRFFQPVQITNARRAFLLLFGGAALAIDEVGEMHDFGAWRALPVRADDDGLPVVGGSLRVPRVLHLRRYDRVRRPIIRLTRQNVMLRDAHQCQYCGRRPPVRDLNIDHVMPRSRGGATSWENLVACCHPCNNRKGNRTPEEAGMKLLRQPRPFSLHTSRHLMRMLGKSDAQWRKYLFY